MGAPRRELDRIDAESEELREVVPQRAVLTELARGFLLAQHSQPDRAVRFLATFLREQAAPVRKERVDPAPPTTIYRVPFRPFDRGVVDPSAPTR